MERKRHTMLAGLIVSFLLALLGPLAYAREASNEETALRPGEEAKIPPDQQPMPSAHGAVLTLVPNTLSIGFFFHQAKVSVRGMVPAGCDAVLAVEGPRHKVQMGTKGKRLGLWLNVGNVVFENVPLLYYCLSSRPLASILPQDAAEDLTIGLDAVKNSMTVHSDGWAQPSESLKDEYVSLSVEEGRFVCEEGTLRVHSDGTGSVAKIEGQIHLPGRLPQGDYRVVLLAVQNGRVLAEAQEALSVKWNDSVAFLYRLAMTKGWLYGSISILAALAAGLGVGAIAGSRGGH
jgi:hypothetical protein